MEGRTSIRPSTANPLSFVGRVARIHRVGDGPGVARFTFTTADVPHCWKIPAVGLRARRLAALEARYQNLPEEGTEKKEGARASGDRTGQIQVWLVHAHLQFHVVAQRRRNQEQKESAKQEIFCRDKNKNVSSFKAYKRCKIDYSKVLAYMYIHDVEILKISIWFYQVSPRCINS